MDITEKNFRQWIIGLMVMELEIPLTDLPRLLKAKECAEQIVRFKNEHNIVKEKAPPK